MFRELTLGVWLLVLIPGTFAAQPADDDLALAIRKNSKSDFEQAIAVRHYSLERIDEYESMLKSRSLDAEFLEMAKNEIAKLKPQLREARERAIISKCEQQRSLACYETFLDQNKDSMVRHVALQGAIDLIAASNENKSQSFIDFYLKYPDSRKLMPEETGFLLSGPRNVEIFVLKSLLDQGLPEADLVTIVLNAKGDYPAFSEKSSSRYAKLGFGKRLVDALAYKDLLGLGKEVTVKSIIASSKNGVRDDAIIRAILSNERYKRLSKPEERWLASFGLSKNLLEAISYNRVLSAGPDDYKMYDILADVRGGRSKGYILSKIDSRTEGYREFSKPEQDDLLSLGLTMDVLNRIRTHSERALQERDASIEKNYAAAAAMARQAKEAVLSTSGNDYVSGRGSGNVSGSSGNGGDPMMSAAKKVGGCIAKGGAESACDKLPFPLNLGCKVVARNALDC